MPNVDETQKKKDFISHEQKTMAVLLMKGVV